MELYGSTIYNISEEREFSLIQRRPSSKIYAYLKGLQMNIVFKEFKIVNFKMLSMRVS